MAENRQLARDEVAASADRANLRQQRHDMEFLATQVHSIDAQLPDHATRDEVDDLIRDLVCDLRAARGRH